MPRLLNLTLLVGGTLLALYVMALLLPYLLPFLLGALLAAAIEPLVSPLQRIGLPRGWAVLATLFFILLGAGGLGAVLLGQLTFQVLGLIGQLPAYYRDAIQLSDLLTTFLGRFLAQLPPSAHNILNSQMGTLYQASLGLLKTLLGLLFALPKLLIDLVVAFVAGFFMSRDKDKILGYLGGFIPEKHVGKAGRIREEVALSLLGFLRAQLILVVITALGTTVGLYFLGVPYQLLIGLFAGLLDFLPYVGPSALFLPWIAYTALFGGSLSFTIGLGAVWLGVGILRQLFEARVVAGQMGIHPLTALVALYVGVEVFGAFGFLLGPLIAVVLIAVIRAGGVASS